MQGLPGHYRSDDLRIVSLGFIINFLLVLRLGQLDFCPVKYLMKQLFIEGTDGNTAWARKLQERLSNYSTSFSAWLIYSAQFRHACSIHNIKPIYPCLPHQYIHFIYRYCCGFTFLACYSLGKNKPILFHLLSERHLLAQNLCFCRVASTLKKPRFEHFPVWYQLHSWSIRSIHYAQSGIFSSTEKDMKVRSK